MARVVLTKEILNQVSDPDFDPILTRFWNQVSGVHPVGETHKIGTHARSLKKDSAGNGVGRNWLHLAKRTQALLESNLRRNNQVETHRNDEEGGEVERPLRLSSGIGR